MRLVKFSYVQFFDLFFLIKIFKIFIFGSDENVRFSSTKFQYFYMFCIFFNVRLYFVFNWRNQMSLSKKFTDLFGENPLFRKFCN